MLAPLRRTLRERIDRRSIAGALAFTALLAWLFDQSFGSAVNSLAAAVLVGGSGLVADAYGLSDAVRRVGLGAWVLLAGGALDLLDGDADETVGLLLALGGVWLLLDGVQELRHEGVAVAERDPADGEAVYRQYLAQRLREDLRERPATRRELRERFDETPDAVDDALALLERRDLVVREGSAYVARDREERGWGRRALARLARPVTRELDHGTTAVPSDETGRHRTTASDRPPTDSTRGADDREPASEHVER
ncbi:hypothetical protein [Halomarina rubra]|uniref:MFS transporter n=1 Tax=Halomarina rubra TaxID=2071873 RepID=A0ABD6AVK3_9EURY|nr:hypothetical protein [Halomarina rubra]